MNVLLVGEESAGIQVLKMLDQSDHRVAGVMAKRRNGERGVTKLWSVAERMGYRLWPAERVKDPDFSRVVKAEKIDLLLNIHSLYIINADIVSAPSVGSFNLHPGPLPQYAGLNTPSWALYQGEKSYGVTVHKMEASVDAGEIAYQAEFPIADSDTALTLSLRCVKHGVPLVRQLIGQAEIDPGGIPLKSQDLTKRNLFGRKIPEDGWLSWDRKGRGAFNFVRACNYLPFRSPWGHPRTMLRNKEIMITTATLVDTPASEPPGTVGEVSGAGAQVSCAD
ncbi:MAG: hypothetical protein KAJ12_05105, partial [Bacteroidetes bacterium]|nr:hypothetical protein [Bacteroidota bacterium]